MRFWPRRHKPEPDYRFRYSVRVTAMHYEFDVVLTATRGKIRQQDVNSALISVGRMLSTALDEWAIMPEVTA